MNSHGFPFYIDFRVESCGSAQEAELKRILGAADAVVKRKNRPVVIFLDCVSALVDGFGANFCNVEANFVKSTWSLKIKKLLE